MRTSQETPALFSACTTTRTSAFALAALIAVALHATAASGQTKAAPPAQQQSDDTSSHRRTAARQQSTVRGRVVYDDTDRPLRRVGVRIYDPNSRDGRGHRMAWTDGRGEFVIKNVAAGTYYVRVEAPGAIAREQTDSGEPSEEVASVSVDGTNSGEVKIRVRRGGAISGKITYQDGDPVINATISMLRKKGGKLLPVYTGGGRDDRARTDERGVYRVSGLLPGEYIVSAAEEKMRAEEREDEDGSIRLDRAVLAATYYPGATSAATATPLQIEAGGEIEDVNITLIERGLHALSGTVTARSDGRPIPGARIRLAHKDQAVNNVVALSEPRSATTDAQGRWALDEIGDGTYVITAAPTELRRARLRAWRWRRSRNSQGRAAIRRQATGSDRCGR